jgi:hypothetical protein
MLHSEVLPAHTPFEHVPLVKQGPEQPWLSLSLSATHRHDASNFSQSPQKPTQKIGGSDGVGGVVGLVMGAVGSGVGLGVGFFVGAGVGVGLGVGCVDKVGVCFLVRAGVGLEVRAGVGLAPL